MQISPNRVFRGLLLTVVYLIGIFGIAASGGGGGDDGPTSISYSGNTDPAVISRSNAARLVGNVLTGQTIVGSSSGGAAKGGASIDTTAKGIGFAQFPGRLAQMLRNAMQSSSSSLSRSTLVRARTDVDETEPCDNSGGSLHITGFIEDNGTGTLTLEYTNCLDDGETLDGTLTAQINAFDFAMLIPTDVIFNFAILTLTSSTINVSLSGSIHSQVSIGTQTEQLTVDRLVTRDNATGEMLMIRNQVSVIDYDNIFSPSSFSETITGRIYDSTHGYVDFSTIVAIIFSSITQEYPDGGQLLLTGSLNSGIQVTVMSETHTHLDLNLDGDASFEILTTLSWSELEITPDLADSDGDGMHDSWEEANGLNSSDSTDANLDPDSDGFSNLEEYFDGFNPNDPGSAPLLADLSITKTTIGTPTTGSNFTYRLNIRNVGDLVVNDIDVVDTLPSEVTFISYSSAVGWTCNQAGVDISCSRDSLNVGMTSVIDITVTLPIISGSISNTASVSSTTFDANQANNSATLVTNVAPAMADLSIVKDASVSAVGVGDNLTYTVTIRNHGPHTAADVEVTDIITADLTFVSATPTQGNCSGSTTVICNLGMVNNFQIVNIDIIVVPTIEGVFSNTASVTSTAQDPDSSNNNSTEITTVGVSASVIQSQIDAAANRDTISVAPGTYIGTIDFLGKAINVVSEQGPLVTIIDGAESSSPVVNFVNGEGPGSVFSGFTVQNGNNGGINVSNASPMITNNIIQNNLKPGSGVGIEIAFSSATVSGNIIRGNNRGPGSGGGGGGISVRGAASAQILNNLIVDNLWGGGIDLFAAGTPLVQNNLISGNHGFGLGIANAMEGEIVQNLIVQNIGPGINNISVNGTFTGNTIALNSGPGINTFGFPTGSQFYNNIIVGAVGIPAIDCSNFGADIDPNLFRFNNVHSSGVSPYVGFCTDQTGTNGNISVAPDFVDSANEDFRLNPTSLAIDAGDNMAPSLPVVDYLGSSRIVDGDQNGSSIVDMGAYEYIP